MYRPLDGLSQDLNQATRQMTEFIKSLKDIEQLTLTYQSSILRKRPISGLRQRVGVSPTRHLRTIQRTILPPRLSNLSIGLYSFNEGGFLAFMQRHSKLLRRLKGIRLNLVGQSCSWRSAVQRMAPVMSLDNVHLRYLLDDEIMTFKATDVLRVLKQYHNRASLYLKLNVHTEYPSPTAFGLTARLNPEYKSEESQIPEIWWIDRWASKLVSCKRYRICCRGMRRAAKLLRTYPYHFPSSPI